MAAILLIDAWGMCEARRFMVLMRMSIGERTVLLLTFLLTILVDLTVAIGVGVTLASLMFMARMSESVEVSAESEDPAQREALPEDVEVFRINGPFFFGVAGELLDGLKRIGRTPRAIILRLEQVPFVDASGILALEEFLEQARRGGTRVILCAPPAGLTAALRKAHGGEETELAGDYPAAIALAG